MEKKRYKAYKFPKACIMPAMMGDGKDERI